MDINDAMMFLRQRDWQKSKPGLFRIRRLLDLMGRPDKRLRFVHVGGTNGKGSFCSMCASVLQESGYKTGLFTSPYIMKFGERWQINSTPITDTDLIHHTELVMKASDEMQDDPPTTFERITAVAMSYFSHEQCDVVVLEVGLGGRFDATNAIETAILSVVMTIDFDHTQVLGTSISEISAEKAGIVKPGVPVLLYPTNNDVETVFLDVCEQKKAPLHLPSFENMKQVSRTYASQTFDYPPFDGLRLSMSGSYQPYNAAMVVEAVGLLREQGMDISDDNVRDGLRKSRWPARFEVIDTTPICVIDGAHNPQSAKMLANDLKAMFCDKRICFVVGVMQDKDYETMFLPLIELMDSVICARPDVPRALDASVMSEFLIKNGVSDVKICPDIDKAMDMAWASGADVVCTAGSLYVAGSARNWACVKGFI